MIVEFVILFFARVLTASLYNRTGRSVLLVAIFHASFNASISELSFDLVPGTDTTRFLPFNTVIVLWATVLIVLTRGRLAGGSRAPRHENPGPAAAGTA